MTKLQTKKYFEGYLINMARAQHLKRELEFYIAAAPSIKKEIAECIKRSNAIEGVIISHSDICEREIMLRKYVYGQTIERIAEELCYSERQVQRILNSAVEKISVKIK